MMKIGIIGLLMVLFFSCQPERNGETALPKVHFSHGKNWTGEPAGAVYHEGTYHLFYQHNPNQPMYGNIHWRHAVSQDLIHWAIQPVALSPDEKGQPGSGSVIADIQNTAGLGANAFLAFYTYLGKKGTESAVYMAYSLDRGETWTKREQSLLIPDRSTTFKNPVVLWDNEYRQWIMTISTGFAIWFYTSTDGLTWTVQCAFEEAHGSGGWESALFFPLTVAEEGITKWVLLVSMNDGPINGAPNIRYFVGDFDGKAFACTQYKELWVDYGKDFYRATLFNRPDNRKVMTAWMNSWDYANLTPEKGQRGRLSIPRELALVKEDQNYLLTSVPVREIATVFSEKKTLENIDLSSGSYALKGASYFQQPFILHLAFDHTNRYAFWNAKNYGVRFQTISGKRLTIGYKADMGYYYIDRRGLLADPFSDTYEQLLGIAYFPKGDTNEWKIVYDRESVELYTADGKGMLTALWFSDEPFVAFELFAEEGRMTLQKASINSFEIK
ncbi:MAG: glycoside hydrolase family 32 protein [Tannerellaceae bacterium]|jgi:fructan beta-fructosidase|nr:glycoside hydrolase family 32 protein [Tannerellaceae bacterium]